MMKHHNVDEVVPVGTKRIWNELGGSMITTSAIGGGRRNGVIRRRKRARGLLGAFESFSVQDDADSTTETASHQSGVDNSNNILPGDCTMDSRSTSTSTSDEATSNDPPHRKNDFYSEYYKDTMIENEKLSDDGINDSSDGTDDDEELLSDEEFLKRRLEKHVFHKLALGESGVVDETDPAERRIAQIVLQCIADARTHATNNSNNNKKGIEPGDTMTSAGRNSSRIYSVDGDGSMDLD